MTYALGVGVGLEDSTRDVRFTTENTRDVELQCLPTFATIAGLPGSALRWSELGIHDVTMLVHGEHEVVLHRSLPTEGKGEIRASLASVVEKSSGATIEVEFALRGESGDLFATNIMTLFLRGATGFESTPGRPSEPWQRPERDPDFSVTHPTAMNQALLYRLSGDHNRIHGDPAAAQRAGFPRPILQGLATFGFAGRALIEGAAADNPSHLRSVCARFAHPVLPGDTLTTHLWQKGGQVLFESTNQDGKVVLGRGRARVGTQAPSQESPLKDGRR